MSIYLMQHINHMKLKNWAYSLFEPCEALFHIGFVDVRSTPAILTGRKTLSPDIVAWSEPVTLILDAKSGNPNPDEDFDQVKEYLLIPKETLEKYLGQIIQEIETVLLYFEGNLKDSGPREALLSKIALERKIIIWSLDERSGQVRLFYGNHSNSDLNKLLNARIPVSLIPPPRIFLQPDSPTSLIARELFLRLLQRAYRYRSKEFSLNDAHEELNGQVYAFSDNEEYTKTRKAIRIGVGQGLCRPIRPDLWALNLVLSHPERYFEKLNQLLKQERMEEFF